MKSAFPILLAVAMLSCTTPTPPQQNPVKQGTTTETSRREESIRMEPAPEVPTPSRSNLSIQQPVDGGTVTTNPIVVTGLARTFENHVALRLLDGDGKVLGATTAVATGDAGTLNPYQAAFYLTSEPPTAFLTVEAIDYSARDGSVAERVTAKFRYDARLISAMLYFPRPQSSSDDCRRVEPARRKMPATTSLARTIVEALLRGPLPEERKQGFSSPFPEKAALRSVNLKDGVLIVDFNESLGNVGGSCRAQAARAALEKSLLELPSVKSVRILSMGNEATALQP